MGKSKETSSSQQSSTQVAQPTAEETALNKLDLEARQATQPGLIKAQTSGLNLSNLLLQGLGLPGYLGQLPGGISEDVTQDIVGQSLRDIQPGFQQSGLLDSGVRASISARTAGDVRRQSAQFNIQNLQQLLNLALGGQAQVQQPIIGQAGAFGERLGGLRSITQTGGTTTTTKKPNVFLQSFAQGAGQGLGGAFFR